MFVLSAPAKINLWLRVLARELGTGYHQIETGFCRLRLADRLAFEALDAGFELVVEGADLGDPGDNLVTRAARAFQEAVGFELALRIRLTKNIPAGAGLGGGSSDAAATLLGLNRMHGEPLDPSALNRLATGIGADVPFLLSGAPFAIGWGRGDRLLALPAPPVATVLLVCPPTPVPTAEAYRALPPPGGGFAPPLRLDALRSWASIAQRVHNDFEAVAARWVPALPGIRSALLEAGARFAVLTGSGSTVYGLFDQAPAPGTVSTMQALFPEAVTIETQTAADPLAGVDPATLPD